MSGKPLPISNMDAFSLYNTTATSIRLVDSLSMLFGHSKDQLSYGPNQSGAVIFFSYIVVALLLSGFILATLFTTYQELDAGNKIGSRIKIGLLLRSTLALLSFSILSYHMLMFLVDSYIEWASIHGIALPRTYSPLNFLSQLHIWEWASNTPLFTAFAYDVFRSQEVGMITGLALAWEMMQSVYLVEAAGASAIEHIWMYVLLAQILPISFVQNLFELARVVGSYQEKPTQPSHRDWSPIARIFLQLIFCIGIPTTYGSTITLISNVFKFQQRIIPAVLLTRILLSTGYLAWLLVPALVPHLDVYDTLGHKWVLVLTYLGILRPAIDASLDYGSGWLQRQLPVLSILLSRKAWIDNFIAMQSSHAAAALGWDVMIAVASWLFCSVLSVIESRAT